MPGLHHMSCKSGSHTVKVWSLQNIWTMLDLDNILQDIMALSPTYISRPAHEETINDPAVRRHYWCGSVPAIALITCPTLQLMYGCM